MKQNVKKDGFKEILRKSGYKATHIRLAILELFKENRQPMSAQEVIEAMPRGTDQVTVYRSLKSFKEKGILRQVDLRHNHAHYELANMTEHHHLICLRCGRIEDVHQCGVEGWEKDILKTSKHFSEIKQHALEFYGICKSCIRKENVPVVLHKNAPI